MQSSSTYTVKNAKEQKFRQVLSFFKNKIDEEFKVNVEKLNPEYNLDSSIPRGTKIKIYDGNKPLTYVVKESEGLTIFLTTIHSFHNHY